MSQKVNFLQSPQVLKALEFSAKAHTGQVRKYTNAPYIDHPVGVAEIVSKVSGATVQMIQAALLHDVIEDCGVTEEQIKGEFGNMVSMFVWYLTSVKDPDKKRAVRKAEYRDKLAEAPGMVHTIKLADMLHNFPDIVFHDPKLAKIWIPEQADLWKVLKGGDEKLRFKVQEAITVGAMKLVAKETV